MMKVTSTAKRIDKSSVLHLHRPNQTREVKETAALLFVLWRNGGNNMRIT